MLNIYSNTLRTVAEEPEQLPEEEESTEEEVENETPRPKNYQRTSLNSTFDLRRSAVKRARTLEEDDDSSDDDNSDDSFDSIDFPQTPRTPKTPETPKTPKTSNTPDILEKKRKLYIKSMKQFRNTKDPWTEEEKLACSFFHMALPTIQKSENEANLKDFQPQLSKVSAHKIYHKVKAAWKNVNKNFPCQ